MPWAAPRARSRSSPETTCDQRLPRAAATTAAATNTFPALRQPCPGGPDRPVVHALHRLDRDPAHQALTRTVVQLGQFGASMRGFRMIKVFEDGQS